MKKLFIMIAVAATLTGQVASAGSFLKFLSDIGKSLRHHNSHNKKHDKITRDFMKGLGGSIGKSKEAIDIFTQGDKQLSEDGWKNLRDTN